MKISFFQPPEFLTLPIFGLSLSSSSIRIVKLKKDERGLIPQYVDEVTFVETCDFFKDGGTYNECGELKKNLIALKKKYKINFVQLSIPEEESYIFKLLVPQEALNLVEDFISNNIEQYIPLTSAEVYFDYKILESPLENNQKSVIVTAIPKIVVEEYAALLESCDLYMVGCEPETHAITRCVINKNDPNPYLILNISEYATSISVVEEGLVQYTQTVSLTSFDIKNGITSEGATLLKDTINRVIIYWFTSKDKNIQAVKIENIVITGVDVDNSEIINFFETNLAVNASFADAWKNCFDIQEYIPNISKKDSLKYATSIGLALFKLK